MARKVSLVWIAALMAATIITCAKKPVARPSPTAPVSTAAPEPTLQPAPLPPPQPAPTRAEQPPSPPLSGGDSTASEAAPPPRNPDRASGGHAKRAAHRGKTAAVTTNQPPPVDEAELLQKMIESLPEAQTVLQHPDPMQVQRADKVTVRVSRNMTADLTTPAAPLRAQQKLITEHDTIQATPFLRVRLSGDPYFKVDNLSDDEQLVGTDTTEWSFNVIPQKAGTWPLHLSITRVFRTPEGMEKVKDYPAKDEYVKVSVMPAPAALANFVRKNWQWLWTTVLVPLVVFLWNHRRKKKKKNTHHASRKGVGAT